MYVWFHGHRDELLPVWQRTIDAGPSPTTAKDSDANANWEEFGPTGGLYSTLAIGRIRLGVGS